MKIRYAFLIGAIATCLGACKWGDGDTSRPKPDITTDTLSYTTKTIKERAADCVNKPDSTCTTVNITYPAFVNQSALNDTVKHRLMNLFMSDKVNYDMTSYVKQFLARYERFKKDDPKSVMFFELESHAKVIRQDSNLTTLEISGYNFQGGAHGSAITTFINWDTKAKKDVKLGSILMAGYEKEMTKVAEVIFRQQEKLTPTASLANDYFFKDDTFALNENFSITPIGLKFLYNQYEIKPYAAGQTILLVPYAKIKTLLKPHTVITQYLN
jgi:hypothetical protein